MYRQLVMILNSCYKPDCLTYTQCYESSVNKGMMLLVVKTLTVTGAPDYCPYNICCCIVSHTVTLCSVSLSLVLFELVNIVVHLVPVTKGFGSEALF